MPNTAAALSLAEAKVLVDDVLQRFCTEQRKKAVGYDPAYGRMWQVIDDYLQTGGKRIRPYLVLLSYQAYGGRDLAAVAPIAAAWELLHACLLVHDDIIDKDTVRHGRPNIAGVYKVLYGEPIDAETSHHALSAALLAGDLLLSGSQQLIMQAPLDPSLAVAVHGVLSDALFGVGGGELLDIESVFEPLDSAQPEKVARFKTAEYSFELPMVCGALLAGASHDEQQKLRLVGREIGVAFQLVDDVLGVFGDTERTGKSVDTDIYEQKRTVLVQQAMSMASPEQQRRLQALYRFGYSMSATEVQEVKSILETTGARAAVQVQAQQHIDASDTYITQLTVTDACKDMYRALAQKMIARIA
jgi:geranylgeranyl pyrophosphate synthase